MDEQEITDALLYGLDPVEKRKAQHAMQAGAAINTAIHILQGANLAPRFGVDLDDVQELWCAELGRFDALSIIGAARDWIVDAHDFPDLAEFTVMVERRQRHADTPPPPERRPGQACPECGEYEGQPDHREGRVNLTDPTQGGIGTSRPCSLCRPEQHALWKAGHYMPRETPSACRCKHPLCPDAKKRARAAQG